MEINQNFRNGSPGFLQNNMRNIHPIISLKKYWHDYFYSNLCQISQNFQSSVNNQTQLELLRLDQQFASKHKQLESRHIAAINSIKQVDVELKRCGYDVIEDHKDQQYLIQSKQLISPNIQKQYVIQKQKDDKLRKNTQEKFNESNNKFCQQISKKYFQPSLMNQQIEVKQINQKQKLQEFEYFFKQKIHKYSIKLFKNFKITYLNAKQKYQQILEKQRQQVQKLNIQFYSKKEQATLIKKANQDVLIAQQKRKKVYQNLKSIRKNNLNQNGNSFVDFTKNRKRQINEDLVQHTCIISQNKLKMPQMIDQNVEHNYLNFNSKNQIEIEKISMNGGKSLHKNYYAQIQFISQRPTIDLKQLLQQISITPNATKLKYIEYDLNYACQHEDVLYARIVQNGKNKEAWQILLKNNLRNFPKIQNLEIGNFLQIQDQLKTKIQDCLDKKSEELKLIKIDQRNKKNRRQIKKQIKFNWVSTKQDWIVLQNEDKKQFQKKRKQWATQFLYKSRTIVQKQQLQEKQRIKRIRLNTLRKNIHLLNIRMADILQEESLIAERELNKVEKEKDRTSSLKKYKVIMLQNKPQRNKQLWIISSSQNQMNDSV